MPWKVSWKVVVDGRDMTDAMRPWLIDIEVNDQDGAASDSCSLTFDDTDGQVVLPAEGAKVMVHLEGVLVFAGTVDTVRSTGTRGGGRLLKVGAKGMDSRGKAKEPQQFHMDDGSLGDFLYKAAQNAGLAGLVVDGGLAAIMRDYWAADGESFIHVGQKLARRLGATFKIRAGAQGDVAVLRKRDAAMGMPAVSGVVGRNVIAWDIAPLTGRRVFTEARVTWFDREAAAFKHKDVEIDLGRDLPQSRNVMRTLAADEDEAADAAEARKGEAKREGGEGTVELDLAPEAQAESTFVLSGARPGIDGSYRIVGVRHKASRSGGSTTALQLKQPDEGAGKDSRGKGEAGEGGGEEQSSGDGGAATPETPAADAPAPTLPLRRYGRTDMN